MRCSMQQAVPDEKHECRFMIEELTRASQGRMC